MRGRIAILLTAICFLLCFASTSYAIAISQSSGTMTVSWSDFEGIIWDDEIYTFNGADASNGVSSISDYPGSGIDSAIAAFGTGIVGQASTSTSSVSSSAEIANDGVGLNQSASGTSHINRSFTVDYDGYWSNIQICGKSVCQNYLTTGNIVHPSSREGLVGCLKSRALVPFSI